MRRCLTTLDENVSEARYSTSGHRRGRGRGLLVLLSPRNSVTREPAEVPPTVANSPPGRMSTHSRVFSASGSPTVASKGVRDASTLPLLLWLRRACQDGRRLPDHRRQEADPHLLDHDG